jgi:hypothetical protein
MNALEKCVSLAQIVDFKWSNTGPKKSRFSSQKHKRVFKYSVEEFKKQFNPLGCQFRRPI